MLVTDPWAFGLNHLLTVAGFLITGAIAWKGFRSFEKWKREKLEERRIEIAFEALELAYDADRVFGSIRSPMTFGWEWSAMKGIDDADRRQASGPFFAILKRLDNHKDYFERALRIQPRFMAAFGKDSSEIFENLFQARRNIEVSAEMLMDARARHQPFDDDFDRKLLNEVFDKQLDNDPIKPLLAAFVDSIENHALPVVTYGDRLD